MEKLPISRREISRQDSSRIHGLSVVLPNGAVFLSWKDKVLCHRCYKINVFGIFT